MTNVATSYEANVGKYAGDALLCLFGAPVAHEDDADRALHVAIEMHEALERLRPTLIPQAQHLRLHVGVNTGHVVATLFGGEVRLDYNVLGDSVNLAQRLESAASPGETYVGESTYRLTRDRFVFERVGDLALKGKRDPTPAWRLDGIADMSVSPSRAAAPLIGRESEVAMIVSALTSASQRGSVFAILAEAGVGKSRLLEEIRARAGDVVWLASECVSYGSGTAYRPYVALLRRFIAAKSEPTLAAEAASIVAAMTAGPLSDESIPPEALRRRLQNDVAALLEKVATHRPVALVIEDVHWADQSSIDLTEAIIRQCAALTLTVVVTGRPEAREVAERLASPEAGTIVDLSPLSERQTTSLLTAILGGPPPKALEDLVAERTAGNPFFTEEIVRALRESGALVRNGDWHLNDVAAYSMPATVEGLISGRLDRLAPSAATAAAVASVVGHVIRLRLLRALPLPPSLHGPALDDAIAALVTNGFVERVQADDADPAIVFRHALVQEVVYNRLLRRRRKDLHRDIGAGIESLYGTGDDVISSIARHRWLAGDPTAVSALRRAAELARGVFANSEAILHFTRALDLVPDEERADLCVEIGDLYDLCGRYDEAYAMHEQVRALRPTDVRGWAGSATALVKRGDYDGALRLLDDALSRTGSGTGDWDVVVLRVEQGWALSGAGRYAEALAALRAGLAQAEGRRDGIVARLLVRLARVETIERELDLALEHGMRALGIFEEENDLRGMTAALRELSAVYHWRGRLDAAADSLRRARELCDRTGNVEEAAGSLINLALIEMERGHLDTAIELDRAAIDEFERIGHAAGRAIGYGNLADKYVRNHAYDDALAACDTALRFAESIGRVPTVADVHRTMAKAHLALRRFEDAARAAEHAASMFETMGIGVDAAECLMLAAEAFDGLGDKHRSDELRVKSNRSRQT